jgi:hypothetical protein
VYLSPFLPLNCILSGQEFVQACFDDVRVNCKRPHSVCKTKISGPVHFEASAPRHDPAYTARPRAKSNPSVALEILHSKQVVFAGETFRTERSGGCPGRSQSDCDIQNVAGSVADPKSNQAKVHDTSNGIFRSSEKSLGMRFRTFMFGKEGVGVQIA